MFCYVHRKKKYSTTLKQMETLQMNHNIPASKLENIVCSKTAKT